MTLNTFIERTLSLTTIALSAAIGYLIFSILLLSTMFSPIDTLRHGKDYTQLEELPSYVKNAFIAAEDNYFEVHHGIDYSALFRAAKILFLTGRKLQGGSTITMQLARNLYLNKEKTYWRKLKELYYAHLLEKSFSKNDILSFYLNKIYFGHNCYGIKQASMYYFGTQPNKLSLAQAATLASLPVAPAKKTPLLTPVFIYKKRNLILKRMHGLGMVSTSAYLDATQKPLI